MALEAQSARLKGQRERVWLVWEFSKEMATPEVWRGDVQEPGTQVSPAGSGTALPALRASRVPSVPRLRWLHLHMAPSLWATFPLLTRLPAHIGPHLPCGPLRPALPDLLSLSSSAGVWKLLPGHAGTLPPCSPCFRASRVGASGHEPRGSRQNSSSPYQGVWGPGPNQPWRQLRGVPPSPRRP